MIWELRNLKLIGLKIAEADRAGPSPEQVVDLMPIFLRVEGGCPWDRIEELGCVWLKISGPLAPVSFFQSLNILLFF